TLAEVRAAVGGGLAQAMGRFLPPELVPAAMEVHLAHSRQILLEDVKLLPGALDLVRQLHARGLTLAVFTNKHADSSRRICAHLGLTPYLAGIYGAGDTPWLKPQPEFATHVLKELKADPASTLLIGDSPFDVQAARNGGFACWCVTTGTHDAAQLAAAGAGRVFTDLHELGLALAR
ncbi:MAG TPA: HAD family hydrolase, partial [Opitutaceae bacterium]|nr:HAD family hydrolase [Opitutaceae bacterium]